MRCSVKKVRSTLNTIIEKFLRKSLLLLKLQILKMNSFTHIFQEFCLKFEVTLLMTYARATPVSQNCYKL